MTQYPNSMGPVYGQPAQPPSNGLGIAGFVMSLVGIVTCGLLAPIGLILSIIGLKREPRGLAIAGTIIGALGTLWLIAASILWSKLGPVFYQGMAMGQVQIKIQAYYDTNGVLPTDEQGAALIAPADSTQPPLVRYTKMGETTYQLTIPGPDEAFDTADDIPSVIHVTGVAAAPDDVEETDAPDELDNGATTTPDAAP